MHVLSRSVLTLGCAALLSCGNKPPETAPPIADAPIEVTPTDPQLAALDKFAKHLKSIQKVGGYVMVPQGPKLEPGATDERVPALRARMRQQGEALPDPKPAEAAADAAKVYDPDLAAAVQRFQRQYGLKDDGVVGVGTVKALNRTPEERLRQVRAAMQRREHVLASAQDPQVGALVRINIPAFEAEVLEDGKRVIHMKVVVGTRYRKTPLFRSRITRLTLNPTWTVPPTLLREDYLPKLRRNPQKVMADGFTALRKGEPVDLTTVDWKKIKPDAIPYILKQAPGPKNPLGRIIFHMPNKDDIYLHDTNARWGFGLDQRAGSSGCIRLQKPFDLLAFVLADQKRWTKERVKEILDSQETEQIAVTRRVEVELVYESVWVDEAGVVQIREDLYGLEQPS